MLHPLTSHRQGTCFEGGGHPILLQMEAYSWEAKSLFLLNDCKVTYGRLISLAPSPPISDAFGRISLRASFGEASLIIPGEVSLRVSFNRT